MKTAWNLADENIERYVKQLERAKLGKGKVSVQRCRDMIDKWLEYRFDHGPKDLSLRP